MKIYYTLELDGYIHIVSPSRDFPFYKEAEVTDDEYQQLLSQHKHMKYIDGVFILDEVHATNQVVSTYRQYEIARLKEQLSGSDYKMIKCIEATLAGETLPYDFTALRTERESLRKQINELEQEVLE